MFPCSQGCQFVWVSIPPTKVLENKLHFLPFILVKRPPIKILHFFGKPQAMQPILYTLDWRSWGAPTLHPCPRPSHQASWHQGQGSSLACPSPGRQQH